MGLILFKWLIKKKISDSDITFNYIKVQVINKSNV